MTIFEQPLNYKFVSGTTNLPIKITDVQDWLKIPQCILSEHALITAVIKAASGYFEKITGRDLINKTYKTYLDNFPCADGISYYSGVSPISPQYKDNGIKLRKSQLQSITSIEYYIGGVLTTLNSSNYYFTDLPDYSAIYLIEDGTFPIVDTRKQAVKITFVAGYGADSDFVPDDVKQALLQMISYLYENRGDCANSDDMNAATQLFGQFKIVDF
ncbi:MAG: hypothetical protein ACJAY9_000789 [Flavobacteriales bacterium]|jgi:hypothetical protein